MRILITGVTSFLGKATARALLKRGHEVLGVVRPGSRNEAGLKVPELSKLKILHFDFDALPEANEERYRELFRESFQLDRETPLVDVWIHFSWDGIGSKGRQDASIQERNIENAKKAYCMAEILGVKKFLFAGSQAEYGQGDHRNPKPVSEYGKAKLRFGDWAREKSKNGKLSFLHLRIYSVYGYGDHPTTLTNTLVKACLEGSVLSLGPCTQNWNYLEIRDFAEAMWILTENSKAGTGIYDIAGEETKPLRDYVLEGGGVLMAERMDRGQSHEGFMLNFGARGNNAEGNAGMSPDIAPLRKLGFRQKIGFSAGILKLYRRQQHG